MRQDQTEIVERFLQFLSHLIAGALSQHTPSGDHRDDMKQVRPNNYTLDFPHWGLTFLHPSDAVIFLADSSKLHSCGVIPFRCADMKLVHRHYDPIGDRHRHSCCEDSLHADIS